MTPLGSTKTIQVDIALVCATHRKLREEVARGSFREDLYYRLNGMSVTLPALRERSDIRALVSRLALAEVPDPTLAVRFSEGALKAIEGYAWPGNIRQLHNAIRVAIALLDEGEQLITEQHLPEELFEAPLAAAPAQAAAGGEPMRAAEPLASGSSLDEIGRQAAMRALEAAGGNISSAARQLGISRNTLYRKLGKM